MRAGTAAGIMLGNNTTRYVTFGFPSRGVKSGKARSLADTHTPTSVRWGVRDSPAECGYCWWDCYDSFSVKFPKNIQGTGRGVINCYWRYWGNFPTTGSKAPPIGNTTGCLATGRTTDQSRRPFRPRRESDYSARAASIRDKLGSN